MTGLLRWWGGIGCVLALLLVSHCGEDEPPTQLTARIYVDAALRTTLASLHVTSSSRAGGTGAWTQVDAQTFPASALALPVDVHFVPRAGTPRDKQIEVVVEARDADGDALAQERALVSFAPKKQRLLELWLAPCGGQAACDDSSCHGAACQACVSGQCGAVPSYTGAALPALDPSATPDPNKPRPSGGGGTPGVITCASPGSTIVCDDGNLCNGRETCDPGRAGALANGCARTSPMITCDPGNTCNRESGVCESCSVRSDGDGDREPSTACGGKDCDDSDANRAPGKDEVCDGKDNDCDEAVDEQPGANRSCEAEGGAGSTCVNGACTRPAVPVTIRFRAVLDRDPFRCGAGAGQPRDFRFYVQQLSLINAAGEVVPVAVADRAGFQAGQVALLDFNGEGCVGSAPENSTITGTVPAGDYVGVQFVNGAGAGAPPLTPAVTTGAGSVPFLVAARSAAAPADAGVPEGGVPDAAVPTDAGTPSGTALYLTATNLVRFEQGFDPEDDVIQADFARLFTDVAAGTTCEAAAACPGSYGVLGVPAPQTLFSVP